MVDARLDDNPWETVAPLPLTVVRKTRSTDNLDAIGGPRGEYTQEFVYRNPFYDGHEAEFKGFGEGEVWDRERDSDGDGQMDPELCSQTAIARGEAPLVTKNWFHRGVRPECMDPPVTPGLGSDSETCWELQHRDNPLLGLTGISIRSEVYSPCTREVISASLSEIEVRKLFDSSDIRDDRKVYAIFPNEGRVYKYDPSKTRDGNGTAEEYPWIKITDTDGVSSLLDFEIPPNTYVPASPDGTFHRITNQAKNDNHGYPYEMYNDGFYKYLDDPLYEYAGCDDCTEFYTVAFNPATWVHTAETSKKIGAKAPECETSCDAAHPCGVLRKVYDNDFGELTSSYITYRDWDGSNEHEVEAVKKTYNEFGQVIHDYAYCTEHVCQRHSENVYQNEDDGDLYYSAFIRKEIAHVPDAAVKRFTFNARWDAGTAQILGLVGADGAESAVEYDALGRLTRVYGANPQTGELCSEPTKEVFYHYGNQSSPLSMLETWINTSPEICGSNRWEVMYTWVDATGKGYSTVSPGDKHLGGEAAYPWMMAGITELNRKGAAISTCEPLPLSGPPARAEDVISMQRSVQASMAAQMPNGRWNCAKQEFDAFGRPTFSYTPSNHEDTNATNGYVVSKAEYGVDEGRSFDHLDLFDSDHIGTYSTQRVDGLGRTVLSITRHRERDGLEENQIVERRVSVKWGGEPGEGGGYKVITKDDVIAGVKSNTPISRRVYYDSLGRVRINIDPNFGRWEYEYDDMGQLIRTISPSGNIGEYTYDRAGRLLTEAYNDVRESEYYYDMYPGDAVLGLEDNLEWEGYPAYAVMIGNLVAVKDRVGTKGGDGTQNSRTKGGTHSPTTHVPDATRRPFNGAGINSDNVTMYPAENPNGKTIHFMYGYKRTNIDIADMNSELNNISAAINEANKKGYNVKLTLHATSQDFMDALYSDDTAGIYWSGHGSKEHLGHLEASNITDEFGPVDIETWRVGKNVGFVAISACESAHTSYNMDWGDVLGPGVAFHGYNYSPRISEAIQFSKGGLLDIINYYAR